jgi:6-phosphofructokinase
MIDSPPRPRVGLVFSGGPAPAANAVITAAASSLRRAGYDPVGFLHGYSGLQSYDRAAGPLVEGRDYRIISDEDLRGLRNSRGVFIGTARANPGKRIREPADLAVPERADGLRRVHEGLVDLGVEALISIGGDDTLKTANFLYAYQRGMPEGTPRVRVVHVPKTIDNDYQGIDFTFGFFTAVDVMAKELLNIRADAIATRRYYVVETMGRKAGWLAYGVAVAGEAHLVLGVEDVVGDLAEDGCLSLNALADRVCDLIEAREARGKHYGTIVLAEGLAEMLPAGEIDGLPRDEHGHLSLSRIDLGKLVALRAAARFEERTGREQKITGLQLGYEARCAAPHAFDVMLGCQLGLGAFRALTEEGLDGHMVSVTGQLDLHYVPFEELVDPETLVTTVRFIERGSDFQELARRLETRLPPT